MIRHLPLLVVVLCSPGLASWITRSTTPVGGREIVRRADRTDSAYRALGARHPALVSLGRRGDGALIAPRWVLTAAHVAHGLPMVPPEVRFARISGKDHEIARAFLHPEWTEMGPHDIALLELARPVEGVSPVALYRAADETKRVALLLGHGKSGTGEIRNFIDDGIARGATSLVDSANASWLYFSFDAPPLGTDLEGAPGPGDSGGPAILEIQGKPFVAGVSSAGYDGRAGPATYGAIDVFTRVSTHAAWIDSVMSANHDPTSKP